MWLFNSKYRNKYPTPHPTPPSRVKITQCFYCEKPYFFLLILESLVEDPVMLTKALQR